MAVEKLKAGARFSMTLKLIGKLDVLENEDWASINVCISMTGYSWSGISIETLQINRETFQATKVSKIPTYFRDFMDCFVGSKGSNTVIQFGISNQ